jgi:hypothetical protein
MFRFYGFEKECLCGAVFFRRVIPSNATPPIAIIAHVKGSARRRVRMGRSAR